MVLELYSDCVIEDWIDYNGHMSEAYYVLVFGFATDALYEYFEIGAEYRAKTNRSVYTLESHIRYLKEVSLGQQLDIKTILASYDSKRLHFVHEMYVSGELVATTEIMGLHLDTGETGGVVHFSDEDMIKFAKTVTTSSPDYVGRQIKLLAYPE